MKTLVNPTGLRQALTGPMMYPLLTLTVTARETFSGSAAINFVKFEGGPEFTANSVQINRFIPAPNFIERTFVSDCASR